MTWGRAAVVALLVLVPLTVLVWWAGFLIFIALEGHPGDVRMKIDRNGLDWEMKQEQHHGDTDKASP